MKEGARPAPQQVCAGGQVPPRASGPPPSPVPCVARQQTWAARCLCSQSHGDPVRPRSVRRTVRADALAVAGLVEDGFSTPAGPAVRPVAHTREKTPCFSAFLKGSFEGESLILSAGNKKHT